MACPGRDGLQVIAVVQSWDANFSLTDSGCRGLGNDSSIPDIDVCVLIFSDVTADSQKEAPATKSRHLSANIDEIQLILWFNCRKF